MENDVRVRWLMWLVLLLAATALRLPAPDWDAAVPIAGTAIAAHPDERYLLDVAQSTPLWGDPCATSLDFPYGHLPVYVARLLVMVAPTADPLYAARLLSGLLGVLLVAVAGAWGRALTGERGALFAAAVMAFAPFPIQQARFYTVDPLGAVLVSGAVLAAMRRRWSMAGALAGLALACKASLVWGGVVVVVGWGIWVAGCKRSPRSGARGVHVTSPKSKVQSPKSKVQSSKSKVRSPKPEVRNLRSGVLHFPHYVSRFTFYVSRITYHVIASMTLAFALASPWSILRPVACWRGPLMQATLAAGRFVVPYTRQYAGTWPFVYPLMQMALWGLGPLVTFVGLLGVVFALFRWRRLSFAVRMACVWTAIYFLAMAGLYAKFPRYLLPLYPAWAGWAIWALERLSSRIRTGLYGIVAASTVLLGIAQVSVYSQVHPWIAASRWIYANVAYGEVVAVEAWDHPLPVPLPEGDPQRYVQVALPIFDADSSEKTAALLAVIERADVIVLASRRGYGALARDPTRNAATLDWYRALLAGGRVVAFGRCPRLGPLALTDDPLADAGLPVPTSLAERCGTRFALRLPRLDESFRVYDAPAVLLVLKME